VCTHYYIITELRPYSTNFLGEWVPVETIVKLKDATVMFKCMNRLAPKYLRNKFIRPSNVHSRNTRNKSKLNIPLCKSETGQHGVVYIATSIWNNPPTCWNIRDLNVFIRSLRKCFLSDHKCLCYFYSLLHLLALYMGTFILNIYFYINFCN